MIRVLIIEDHASMRESLTAAFEQTEDIRTVGEGASAEFLMKFPMCRAPERWAPTGSSTKAGV